MPLPVFIWVPDNTTTGKVDYRLIENQYNDGYRQRVKDGINTRRRTWTLTFGVLDPAESQTIIDWLDGPTGGNAGAATFSYSPAIEPWKGIPVPVTCKGWSNVYDGPVIVGLTMQFEESFTPA
jgi:phage-related protein